MRNGFGRFIAVALLALTASVSGVFATWQFSDAAPQKKNDNFGVQLNEFTFAPKETLQITAVQLSSSNNAQNVEVGYTHPTYINILLKRRFLEPFQKVRLLMVPV